MINQCDLIIDFIEENGWNVINRLDVTSDIIMLWVERPKGDNDIWSLNFVLIDDQVRVMNRFKDRDYIEAEVHLYDPRSLDNLEKVLR